jgi:regulator of cell morphogenesis and NO signaling
MAISQDMSVAEIAATIPASVRVFQRHGIDFCCGGKRPIGAVCENQGLSFDGIAAAIDAAAAGPVGETVDWTTAPLVALTDHIVARYHDPLRDELPRLEAMATKVSGVHGAKSASLPRLAAVVAELSVELADHMRKEELVLFPAIRGLETGRSRAWLAGPIEVMVQEHDHVGDLLAELRALTAQYTPPEWACGTVRALYAGLDELDRSMHLHVHLENNILFPRALRLAEVPHGA